MILSLSPSDSFAALDYVGSFVFCLSAEGQADNSNKGRNTNVKYMFEKFIRMKYK